MQEWTGVKGKRVLMTGATHGIGLAAAEALYRRGAQLAVVARSEARAADAVARIQVGGGGGKVDVLIADLSSLASVRELAAEALRRYPRIDVLVNNAGAMNSARTITADGIELTWAVNHLAPFVLTTALLDRIKDSAPARIVTTASDAHKGRTIPFDDLSAERSYGSRGFARYGETKLANILFTLELAQRLRGTDVTANCFHPGLVATGFNRNNGMLMSGVMTMIRPFSRSSEKGAETLVWLVDSPDASGESGGYFVDERRIAPSRAATDENTARRLWQVSEEQSKAFASR